MRRHLPFLIIPCLLGIALLILNAQVYSWRPIPLSRIQFAALPANEARHHWYFSNGTAAIETTRLNSGTARPAQPALIWDLKSQTSRTGPDLPAEPESRARQMEVSSSGRWLAVAMENCFDENNCKSSLELHDLRYGRRRTISPQSSLASGGLEADDKPNFRLRFSPDEKKLFVAQTTGWDEFEVATGRRLFPATLPTARQVPGRQKGNIVAATMTADGRFLIQTDGAAVVVRELQHHKVVRRVIIPTVVRRPAEQVSFSNDGQLLLIKDAGSPDGMHSGGWWYCYGALTGTILWTAPGENISGLSPDETEMYLYHQTFFEVRDARRGSVLRTLPAVPYLREWWLSMDGQILLSYSSQGLRPSRYFRQRAR